MGEAIATSEDGMELELQEMTAETGTDNQKMSTNTKDGCGSTGVVRWERFLPRRVIRVLLVEADDSTRQIIAALLRKCSYRVVAVGDGLKAWEVLKRKPNSIDLTLTEVDLPSISGFALLTLIMEHDICKHIPVIMMSSKDSISTVYNCMLRGAADFLVKPVRRNELKNLWQHVWRRQSSTSGGHGLQDDSTAQQKVEATYENEASNHSSGNLAGVLTNKEFFEKESEDQSSCTKPDNEAESAVMENLQDSSQLKMNPFIASEVKVDKYERTAKEDQRFIMEESKNKVAGTSNEDANMTCEAGDNNDAIINAYREAIDLIGEFDKYPKNCNFRIPSSIKGAHNIDLSPQLDLSLRRSQSSVSENPVNNTEERHILNHSNASPFSRYVSRTQQPLPETPACASSQQQEYETDLNNQMSNHVPGYNFDSYSPIPCAERNRMLLGTGQTGPDDFLLQRAFSVPVPVRGMRFDGISSGYGSVMHPIYYTQSAPPNSLERFPEPIDQSANNSSSQPGQKQEQKMEKMDDRGHLSSVNGQSGSGNLNQVAVFRENQEGLFIQSGNSQRSIQREAALSKFRLKRKDRCYEKKVRYESRKKLAEQRPRVKGQFVRQVNNEASPAETDN